MMAKIKLYSKKDAAKKQCPYDSNNYDCNPEKCMAWTVVYGEDKREDHSGAQERIHNWARGLGVEPYREGGPGSMGYWCIPETGYCRRLWTILEILVSDYIKY
jgi:hypothetical protein